MSSLPGGGAEITCMVTRGVHAVMLIDQIEWHTSHNLIVLDDNTMRAL